MGPPGLPGPPVSTVLRYWSSGFYVRTPFSNLTFQRRYIMRACQHCSSNWFSFTVACTFWAANLVSLTQNAAFCSMSQHTKQYRVFAYVRNTMSRGDWNLSWAAVVRSGRCSLSVATKVLAGVNLYCDHCVQNQRNIAGNQSGRRCTLRCPENWRHPMAKLLLKFSIRKRTATRKIWWLTSTWTSVWIDEWKYKNLPTQVTVCEWCLCCRANPVSWKEAAAEMEYVLILFVWMSLYKFSVFANRCVSVWCLISRVSSKTRDAMNYTHTHARILQTVDINVI